MIVLRDFKPSDAKALRAIHFNTIRNINSRDYSLEQVKAWAPDKIDMNAWQTRVEGLNPIIAEIEGVIVGYTDLQPSGLIDHFFCHHEYQNRGVGRTLMNHVLTLGKERNLKHLYSEVSITARPFYEHFGFTMAKEKQEEIRGQVLTYFVMEKFNV